MITKNLQQLIKKARKALLLTSLGLGLSVFNVNAQQLVSTSYLFSQSTGTYTPITNGTTVDSAYECSSSNRTLDTEGKWVNLPFTFNYNGNLLDSVYVNSNGSIILGVSSTSSTALNSSITNSLGVISPMGSDLWGIYVTQVNTTSGSNLLTGVNVFSGMTIGKCIYNSSTNMPYGTTITAIDPVAQTLTASTAAGATSSTLQLRIATGKILSKVEGTAPNRVFTVEWKDFADYATSSNPSSILNFQVKFEETTNKIHFVYGICSQSNTTSRASYVGIRGASTSDFLSRTSSTSWTSTTASTASSNTVTRTDLINPPSGLTFTYTPAICPSLIGNAVNITANSATIKWTNTSTPLNYQVYYSTSNATPPNNPTSNILSTTSDSVNLTNLNSTTTYYYFIRKICSTTDTSAWGPAGSFITECPAMTLPYTQDFSTGVKPICWSNYNNNSSTSTYAFWLFSTSPDYGTTNNGRTSGTFAWVDASLPYSGITEVVLESPTFNATNTPNGVEVKFDWYKANSTSSSSIVTPNYDNNKLIVKAFNGTTWNTIFEDTSNVMAWRTESIILPSSYSINNLKLRFIVNKHIGSNPYFYDNVLLDNVIVRPAPTCVYPTNITASNVTSNSVTLTHIAPSLAPSNGYEYYLTTSNTAPTTTTVPTGTLNSTVNNLTLLNMSTTYYYYVRSNCGTTNGVSDWSSATIFTTSCGMAMAPWLENFENQPGTSSTAVTVSNCWIASPNSTSSFSWLVQPTGTTSSSSTGPSAAYSGSKFLYTEASYGSTGSIAYLTTPIINVKNISNDTLSFYYHMYGSTMSNLYIEQSNPSIGTWTVIDSIVGQQQATATAAWLKKTIPFSPGTSVNDTLVQFRFKGIRSTNFYGDLAIDDVAVYGETCSFPTSGNKDSVALCNNTATTLNSVRTGIGVTYQWSNNVTTSSINVNSGGTYIVTSSKGSGCMVNDTFIVYAAATPIVNLGNDTTICNGTTLSLNAGNAGATYLWNNNATSQTITVSQSGTYSLTVTNNAGCQTTDSVVITVIAPPSLGGMQDSFIVCDNSPITMTAPINTGVTYNWKLNNNTVSTNQNYTTSVPGTYTLTVTNASGCTATKNILVLQSATPNVNLGNDTTICSGNTLTLNATTTGASTYLWSNNSTAATLAVSQAGTYWVRAISNLGCYKTDTIVINTINSPVNNLNSTYTLCPGSSLLLNAGNVGATYVWKQNNTTIGTAQTITLNTVGNYSVTITNSNGCASTFNFVVNPGTIPTVNLGNDTAICSSETLVLNASNPGASYLWSNGATSNTINAQQAGTYWVQVTNAQNCVGTDTIIVSTLAAPTHTLNISTYICNNGSTVLDAQNPGATYQWILPNNGTATTQTVTANVPGYYEVSITNANGCTITDSTFVSIATTPNVNLGNDTAFCVGNALVLNPNVANAASYAWNTGAITNTITVTQSGTYAVTVSDPTGTCFGSDTIQITVNETPSIDSISHTVLANRNVNFSVVNPLHASTYVWDFGDGNMGSGLSPIHQYTADGNFVVRVGLLGPCGIDTFQTIINIVTNTSVDNINKDTRITLYPNPANEYFTIKADKGVQVQQVIIYNAVGQEMKKVINLDQSNLNITTDQLASGFYNIRIFTNHGHIDKKLNIIK